ncbi:L,D-transpeptidase family protein [Sphingomonas cavernae]|uniref:L,D-transpeptidase n=1 Tax=Sphingomonas cavernae TaxID=2320861 RepID=A0A418W6F1_9SPHN|nr:L,D-transpeptidase family protein [Sphingomonas cavernae]RJF85592.1 L,D-transpeptidase [Sphingomonas cavernae]
MRRSIIALMLLVFPATLQAQGAKVSSPVELTRLADELKPGQWVWAPEIAPEGPVTIYVDLSAQRATVYRNGVRIAVTTISSGKPGHETPTGVFTILQKDAKHHSSKYNNAAMPYMERLTWDGVALHAGGLPGYPESHGCVHLPLDFSRALFGITALGGTVVVAGSAGKPMTAGAAGVLAPASAAEASMGQLADSGGFIWQPQRAPTGPLTIVISRTDQAAVVLRNGVEIGRTIVQIPRDVPDTRVLTLTHEKDGSEHWIYIGVPGHEGQSGTALDAAVAAQVRVPRGFYTAVKSSLVPGTTILVTQASIGQGSVGQKVTIMDSVPAEVAKTD